ncbi:MAG: EamA family transporter, partial [Planctomycetaceae bacterium]|nr:EamA family transporter [Planctomycetaceae bacterium]
DQISIDQVNHLVIWGLIYQGVIVGGLCFAIQTLLLNKYSASRITVFSFLTPIFGIATAATLRKDPLSPWIFLSLALVAAGIYLVNRPQVNQ